MCAASCANSRADGAGVGEAGVEHNVINAGTEFMSFIEIEYK